jgi:hypothetical protein
MKTPFRSVLAATVFAVLPLCVLGSSHREAPNITRFPAVDSTDFYMFMSYEQDRDGYVTLFANYIPLRDSCGGRTTSRSIQPSATRSISPTTDMRGGEEDLTFRSCYRIAFQTATRGWPPGSAAGWLPCH